MGTRWVGHSARERTVRRGLRLLAGLLLLSALLWLVTVPRSLRPPLTPAAVSALTPGTVASLDSSVFHYSPGWRVSSLGADPTEPAQPWLTPSGVVTFSVTGQEIALLLAKGDYWGYLYVTVDGAPANRLANIPGNHDATGRAAGYTTLYAPEAQTAAGPDERWVVIHRAPAPQQTQTVRVEVWRAWGQTPLRAVAVDALPPPARPRWPAALMVVAAGALLLVSGLRPPRPWWLRRLLLFITRPVAGQRVGDAVAVVGAALVVVAMLSRVWWLGPTGLLLLGYAALASPLRWAAALLVALPFYFSLTLPILPSRATNLIDVGVWGGVAVSLGYWARTDVTWRRSATVPWLVALAGWALVSATAAVYGDLALREWRTIFLAALGFAVLLSACHSEPGAATRKVRVLVGAWLAGGLLMAAIGLLHFWTGSNLIEAEGVRRVRGLYGSPNNLALYLERLLFVPLAAALLARHAAARSLAWGAAALLGATLLLTFSKGALLLGLPAGLLTVWVGGMLLLRRAPGAARPVWWLAATVVAAGVLLAPFAGTERLQRLVDFESGTGMLRLLLWRSSLQMALDHPWLGVGPDNFLYTFRSGYLLPAAWQEPNLNHPHNLVLDWWTRLGLPGLLLGMGWLAAGVWGLARRMWQPSRTSAAGTGTRLPERDNADTWLWLGILGGAVAALAHGLIDLSFAVPDLMLVWVLLFSLPDLAQDDPPSVA